MKFKEHLVGVDMAYQWQKTTKYFVLHLEEKFLDNYFLD